MYYIITNCHSIKTVSVHYILPFYFLCLHFYARYEIKKSYNVEVLTILIKTLLRQDNMKMVNSNKIPNEVLALFFFVLNLHYIILSLKLSDKKRKIRPAFKIVLNTVQIFKSSSFALAKNRSKLYNISRRQFIFGTNIIHPDNQTRLHGLGEMYDEKLY